MSPSKMIDAEFAYLEGRIAILERENEELRRENGELLGKYVAAQDSAYVRMVRSLAGMPVVDEAIDDLACSAGTGGVAG